MAAKKQQPRTGTARFDEAQRTLEKRAREARENTVVQLPIWGQQSRGIPNELVRSALFTTKRAKEPRRYYKDEAVLVIGDGELTYRGEELRTEDEDVWLQVLHLAREQPLGTCVSFRPHAMLRQLGWPRTQYYYARLRTILSRLQATALAVTSRRLGGGRSVSLVRRFDWQDEHGDSRAYWSVWVEEEMKALFGDHFYTLVEWRQRQGLTPTAKRLHDYWASHRNPYPIKVATLRDLCGSSTKLLKRWRQTLRGALQSLVDCGFLEHAWIDDTDKVHVRRAKSLGYDDGPASTDS